MPKKAGGCIIKKLPSAARIIVVNLFVFAVLFIAVALIVGDSYNPFLYFRF